MGRVEIAE